MSGAWKRHLKRCESKKRFYSRLKGKQLRWTLVGPNWEIDSFIKGEPDAALST